MHTNQFRSMEAPTPYRFNWRTTQEVVVVVVDAADVSVTKATTVTTARDNTPAVCPAARGQTDQEL